MNIATIITCEHAGNRVPARYAELFRGRRRLLESHRGYDPGALEMARWFARRLRAPLFLSTVTRLLVELNRSPHHPALHFETVRALEEPERQAILRRYYHPHRSRVESCIAEAVGSGRRALHLSMHTFTPRLDGALRTADVGFLYDPARAGERDYCLLWRELLTTARPDLRVRRNYPYLGTSDGFTTYLRTRFGDAHYGGIEVEVNQIWARRQGPAWRRLLRDLTESAVQALLWSPPAPR